MFILRYSEGIVEKESEQIMTISWLEGCLQLALFPSELSRKSFANQLTELLFVERKVTEITLDNEIKTTYTVLETPYKLWHIVIFRLV